MSNAFCLEAQYLNALPYVVTANTPFDSGKASPTVRSCYCDLEHIQ